MYEVQVMQPYALPNNKVGADWEELFILPRCETEQGELEAARRLAPEMGKYYTYVRIVKWTPDGSAGRVV